MTQVTFPTRLGGNGQTISDDADPNTGLLNGGHRTRFVPALQGTVQMADYVFQYADKINNAASDADRAENARGYVEAVAEAYKVNIQDAYKNQKTLSYNFERGEYKKDDGEYVSTNNISLDRPSPKWVFSPNGSLRELDVNTLARSWQRDGCKGALLEESRTNVIFPSNMQNNTDLGYTRTLVTGPDGVADSAMRLTEDSSTNQRRLRNTSPSSVSFSAGEDVTASIWVRTGGNRNTFTLLMTTSGPFGSDSSISNFLLNNETFGSSSGPTHTLKKQQITKFPNNWWRLSSTYTLGEDVDSLGVWMFFSDGSSDRGNAVYTGDGESFVEFFAAQVESGSTPTSYIPTDTSPVTRAADILEKSLSDEFNSKEGTFFIEFENSNSKPDETILAINNGTQNEQIDLRWVGINEQYVLRVREGGSNVIVRNIGGGKDDGSNTVVFSYTESTFVYSLNGVSDSGPLTSFPSPLNKIEMGARVASVASRAASLNIKNVFYLPFSITETEAATLSAK